MIEIVATIVRMQYMLRMAKAKYPRLGSPAGLRASATPALDKLVVKIRAAKSATKKIAEEMDGLGFRTEDQFCAYNRARGKLVKIVAQFDDIEREARAMT